MIYGSTWLLGHKENKWKRQLVCGNCHLWWMLLGASIELVPYITKPSDLNDNLQSLSPKKKIFLKISKCDFF